MTVRRHGVVAVSLALSLSLSGLVEAQSESGSPRLPDGKPDLQGVWDFRTLTPLQRPEDQVDQAERHGREPDRFGRQPEVDVGEGAYEHEEDEEAPRTQTSHPSF